MTAAAPETGRSGRPQRQAVHRRHRCGALRYRSLDRHLVVSSATRHRTLRWCRWQPRHTPLL